MRVTMTCMTMTVSSMCMAVVVIFLLLLVFYGMSMSVAHYCFIIYAFLIKSWVFFRDLIGSLRPFERRAGVTMSVAMIMVMRMAMVVIMCMAMVSG